MKETVLKTHPLTIFHLIRSYWLVFILPPIRITIQYITRGNTRVILLWEILVISIVIMIAVFSWFLTEITVTNGKLIIKKGILIKSCNVISISRSSGIYIKRNLTDIIFLSASLYINLEAECSEKNCFKIKVKMSDLSKLFGKYGSKIIHPVKRGRNFGRFFVLPAWIAVIILIGSIIVFRFNELAILLIIDAYYAVICYHNYIKGQIGINDDIFAIGSKGLSFYEFRCNKNKIGVIKISQTPADRILKTCKIKMVEHSDSAKGIKVKNIDLKETILSINKNFNLNLNV